MSVKLSAYVWDGLAQAGVKGTQLLVMLRLADFSSDEGTCYPGIETISRQIGAGRSTVITAITQLQKDYVILDNVKGKGHYVGTYMALTTLERYWWGEGEVKFYIDGDEEYPTICGTGTEDYFGGSWSFAKQVDGKTVEQNYCTPYLGYPYYSSHDEMIHNFYHNDDVMPMRGFYRWHIQDPICFDEDLKVTIQQIGVGYRGLFERQDDVASVAYWYQAEPHNSFPELPGKEERWPR
jgi:biotin operon repressor